MTATTPDFAEAHTYATYANAEKQVRKVLGKLIDEPGIFWFIIAQPSGRFSPAVRLAPQHAHLAFPLANNKVCAIA